MIQSKQSLTIPNATEDNDWKDNPDVKLNMISYLGFPIHLPSGEPFGTICVLDSQTNQYTPDYKELMDGFRALIESDLELLFMNRVLGEKFRKASDAIAEIKTLRGLLPICSWGRLLAF